MKVWGYHLSFEVGVRDGKEEEQRQIGHGVGGMREGSPALRRQH